MRKRVWTRLTVLMFCLLLVLSGCGSSDNKATGDYGSSVASDVAETESNSADMAASQTEAPSALPMEAANTASQEPQTLPASGSSGFQAGSIAEEMNKKLIYRANVVMEVKEYSKAQSQIRDLVSLSGGYIIEFSENQSTYEQGGNFVLKVPAAGFNSFLERLEELKPESLQQSIQGQDVSEEYVDLESRLKVKEAVESRYLKFVGEATKTSDLVQFTNELERIQTEIEQIKGRMRYINNNVSYSTIEIRLYQPSDSSLSKLNEDQKPLLERAGNALKGSLEAISIFFQWLVVVLSGALPLLVIAGILLAVLLPLRRRRTEGRKAKSDNDKVAQQDHDKLIE